MSDDLSKNWNIRLITSNGRLLRAFEAMVRCQAVADRGNDKSATAKQRHTAHRSL